MWLFKFKFTNLRTTVLLVVVMDAVDLERVGDDVGDTVKTLTTHHTAETAGVVALITGSQDLCVWREREKERERKQV